jgi:hypothetical protein
MTTVHGTKYRSGKVVIGPRAIGDSYYRIVSLQDRSGRIETFDPRSRSWAQAPESVTFNDVWKAEPISQFALDRACAMPGDDLDDDEIVPEDKAALSVSAGADFAEYDLPEPAVH